MKKNLMLFVLLILFIAIPDLSCGKKDISSACKTALADLTADILINTGVSITAGKSFNIATIIKNVVDVGIECLTSPAGKSEERIKVDYDDKGNGTFSQNVSNANTYVPEIKAGEQANIDYTYKFNAVGQYRLVNFADDKGQVTERNENNNSSTPDITTAKSNSNSGKKVLIINVLPNPNYTKKANEPAVELINKTIRITLQ